MDKVHSVGKNMYKCEKGEQNSQTRTRGKYKKVLAAK